MNSEPVLLHVDDGIATVTLNDPARRNSVSARLSTGLAAVCAHIAADEQVRAVVLTGAGPAFSAGGDLDSLTRRSAPLDVSYAGFAGIAGLPVPVVAAVNGPAVGAGLGFAMAADVIIAGRSARFDPRFLDIGIHPGGGQLWRLQRLVGRQAAAAMIVFGESAGPEVAERLGLVWKVVDDDQLLEAARAMAARVVGRSAELVHRTLSSLRVLEGVANERQALELEKSAQEWSMTRPAFAAGVAALRARLTGAG